MRGKDILVTGGAGFIGAHLVERLCEENKVTIFDNFKRDSLKFTSLRSHPNVTTISGDVRYMDSVQTLGDFSHVIHLAAIAGVDSVMGKPVETMEVALLGTYNLLKVFHGRKIERFIDFSTSEVFGTYAYKVEEGDATSVGAVGEARWTYAVSKLATEHLALNFHKEFGMPTCAIRPFNIFGPNQQGEGAIHTFIKRCLAGEEIEIHNGGDQIRSWCYVSDIVDATILCLDDKKANGHVFNIGNPRNTLTIYQLAKEIKRLTGSKSEIVFRERKTKDVELRIPSITKAWEILGYEPKIDLEEGLRRTIDWYAESR
jgi:nucleoside-diphosphate-sugar epimerase